MRLRFQLGRSGKLGRLTPEQAAVLKRLEAGEIDDEQAAAELDGKVRTWKWSFATGKDAQAEPAATKAPPPQPTEDDAARDLVERVAREVDAES
jgi:hypothetical protein